MRLADLDGSPGSYYVTARDERGRVAWLLGPWTQQRPGTTAHAMAHGSIRRAARLLDTLGHPDAPWLAYGTARVPLGARQPRAVLAHLVDS